MVKYTCLWFWLFIVIVLVITGVTIPFVSLSDFGGDDWTIAEHVTSVNKDTIKSANSQVDASSKKLKKHPFREREEQDRGSAGNIVFLYDWADETRRDTEDNVFTASNLQTMCEIEHMMLGDKKYADFCQLKYVEPDSNDTQTDGCVMQQASIASTFYLAIQRKYNDSCPMLDADKVEAVGKCRWYLAFTPKEDLPAAVQWCNCWQYRQSTNGTKCDKTCSDCQIPKDKKEFDMYLQAPVKKRAQQLQGNFLSSKVEHSPPSSALTRSILSLGSPLFKDGKQLTDEEAEEEQKIWLLEVEKKMFDRFGMTHYVVSSAYYQSTEEAGLRIRWFNSFWWRNEFSTLLTSDFSWLGGSVAFVVLYQRIHTGSYFISIMGLFQIFFSLPVSLFFYRIIGQITFFSQLQILVLFLVLGIGADDIFVLVDGWKQSAVESSPTIEIEGDEGEELGPEAHGPLKSTLYENEEHRRVTFAFKRALVAVFNTSFTTCMAFVATAVSPIMPISTFGIYAAIAIFMNFVFTVLWTPVVVLIWHRYWERKNCCCCCADKPVCKFMFWCAKASASPTKTTAIPNFATMPVNQSTIKPTSAKLDKAESKTAEPSATAPHTAELEPEPIATATATAPPTAESPPTAELEPEPSATAPHTAESDKSDSSATAQSASTSKRPTRCSVDSCFAGCFFNLMVLRVCSDGPNTFMGTSLMTTDPITLTQEYNSEVSKGRRCLPVLALVVALVLATVSGLSFWQAAKLTPPRSAELWLPANHMLQMVVEDMGTKFYAGESDSYVLMHITWGVAGLDRSSFNRYLPNENRGDAEFDRDFENLMDFGGSKSSKHTHHALRTVCEIIDGFSCEGLVDDKLAYAGSVYDKDHQENCWPHFFEKWTEEQGHGMPQSNQPAYGTNLTQFRSKIRADRNIGIIDGKLKFLSLSFRAGLKRAASSAKARIAYDCAEKLADDVDEAFEGIFGEDDYSGMETFRHTGSGKWVTMYTSEKLVFGLFQGLAICFPVAAAVLLISSGNIFIALYAVFSIASIVGFVLGFCKWAMDWDLGTAQSIAGVIVIGFSVDYCVHLAHMYTEARALTARGRTHYALSTMGGTVLGGAITTFGSGAFLFPCQITFFTTMAWLISITILASTTYSLGFFVALCLLMGPDNNVGNIYCCCTKNVKTDPEKDTKKETIEETQIKTMKVVDVKPAESV